MALEFLRKSATSVFAWVLLGLLALIFGLSFGLPSDALTVGVRPIVRVHGDSIGDDDFQYQYNLMNRVLPIPEDARFQKLMGLREEVLDAAVERMVLSRAAEDMGLAATVADAEDLTLDGHLIVLGDTYDWLGQSRFNYELFTDAHLHSLRVPEQRYLEHQRRELLARTLRDLIRASVSVSEAELRAEYDRIANVLSLRYVRFESASYGDLVEPQPEEVDEYVAANRATLLDQMEAQSGRFTGLPEQVRVRIVEVRRPAKDAGPVAVREARRRILAALARIRGGEPFAAVAREVSEDASSARRGGDYGWVSAKSEELDPAVAKAVATLGEGAVSDVLEGAASFYVVRVDGRREGDVPEADVLRELAVEALHKERGRELARQAAEEALLAVSEGKSLSDLFEGPPALGDDSGAIEDHPLGAGAVPGENSAEARPEMQVTGPFPRHAPIPGLGQNPELVRAAWEADPQAEVIPRVFETDSGVVIAGVERREKGSDEGFAEAREALYDQLADRKAGEITARWALRRCLEAKGRGDISGVEEKIARLMVYDTKAEDDGGAGDKMRPYSVCDRVGNRGGILRMGLGARAGGGDAQ
jgi:peptidyl-prolyl cis-trans isomerase D